MLGLFGAALLYGDGVITPAISRARRRRGARAWPRRPSDPVRRAAHGRSSWSAALLVPAPAPAGSAPSSARSCVVWFLVHRRPRHRRDRAAARGAPRGQSVVRRAVLPRGRAPRLPDARRGGAGRHRRRGALRRHGPLRPPPIRLAWFGVVLPALLLNYFGQGALLLRARLTRDQPVLHLVPAWSLLSAWSCSPPRPPSSRRRR